MEEIIQTRDYIAKQWRADYVAKQGARASTTRQGGTVARWRGRQHYDKTSKYSSTRHVGKQEQSYGTEDGKGMTLKIEIDNGWFLLQKSIK